jgi:hypothetical protein
MPGRTPVRSSANILVVHHGSAAHFLSATFPTFRRHEESANIVFAHALKLLGSEAALTGCHFINESDISTWWRQETHSVPLPSSSPTSPRGHVVGPPTANTTSRRMTANGNNEPFWLTVWSSPSPFIPPTLDIVLSCVNWTLGDYPIFLWTPKNATSLSPAWMTPRIELLAEHLLDIVPPCRVFSIFGMTQLVKSFTRHWSELVRCPIEPEPFYAAFYSFCNRETFKESHDPFSRGDSIRRANMEDHSQVAQLCKEFADDSVRARIIPIFVVPIRLPYIDILSARNRCRHHRSAGAYFEWPHLGLRVGRRSDFYLCSYPEHSKCLCDHQSVHDPQMETSGICRAPRSQCYQAVGHRIIVFSRLILIIIPISL